MPDITQALQQLCEAAAQVGGSIEQIVWSPEITQALVRAREADAPNQGDSLRFIYQNQTVRLVDSRRSEMSGFAIQYQQYRRQEQDMLRSRYMEWMNRVWPMAESTRSNPIAPTNQQLRDMDDSCTRVVEMYL